MKKMHETTGPQYFGKSKKRSIFQEDDRSIPGPGAHSPNKISKTSEPQWKIGDQSNRNTFLDPHRAKIPSPQDYKVSHQEVQKLSKKMSIPQATYESKPASLSLTNFYEANHNFTKTAYPQFSFGYLKQTNYSTLAPGPGKYDHPHPKINFNRTQSGFSIGQRPNPYGQQARFPSPDKYKTISTPTSPKYSFGKAARSQNKNNDPPARFYDLQPNKPIIKMGRGKSTEYRREPTFLTPNEYPAPNAYQTELKHKILNGTMNRSSRKPIQNLQLADVPCSDKYAVHKDIQRARVQSFIKDDRHLQVLPIDIPGPGAYALKSTLSNIGGAIPKKQQSSQIKEVAPGAAAYRPQDAVTRRKVNSTLMLRSNRIDFSKTFTGVIGPGQYQITGHLNGELGKMPKSPRKQLYHPDNNPGVGNYVIPSLIGQLPKYCTSPKKITENGFSIFYERQKLNKLKRQKLAQARHIQNKRSEQEAHENPEAKMQQ